LKLDKGWVLPVPISSARHRNRDGLHPNEKGDQVWASLIKPDMKALAGK
jgi:lysophospholipase L1-like esterase